MNFKMLIVDDEPIICRGLQLTVPWADYQVEVVDIAGDGLEAIQKIKAHPEIDLVLTDVRMPNADGLELASFISRDYPHIRTVIISGYDDFKYAQQAIHLGVQDYLLKPVDVDELLEVVRKITGEIQEQRNETQQILQVQLKNAIYHQVVDSPAAIIGPSELVEGLRVYPFISMVGEYSQVTKQMTLEGLQQWKADWENTVETALQRNGFTSLSLFTSKNRLLTCIVEPERCLTPDDIFPIFAESGDHLLFVVPKTSIQMRELAGIYQTLLHAGRALPISRKKYVISPLEETLRQERTPYPDKLEGDLIQAVFQLKEREVNEGIQLLFTYLEDQRYFLEEAVHACSEILTRVVSHYLSLFRKEPLQTDLYFKGSVDVSLDNSYRLLKEMFELDIGQIMSQLERKQTNSKDWLIERAEKYIKQYYQEQIKAYEVADVINISPNYFSTLFKQKTGKSFNEYVNQLRIEAAKQLLEETPFNVNEIAEKVGYREYKYFVDVFKKLTGYSPTHYRKLTSS